ncbi:MAG TPA: glucose-6-phosphate dehydrogenase assembly protein OpcA [Solirubrobacteraceae bacterium]|nr:glucose-6-phosphate dehydrogenase assembly protein OpcA [Solirubrobacteraceae bacterium]
MSEDVWAAQDTHPDAIEAALRELLRGRHAANEALAPARVINLVVVVDREWKGEIANRLERVGRYHASRTLLCAVEEGRRTLDAVATVSYHEPDGSGLGVMHEAVEIDMGPEHLFALQTIADPILVGELPTVVWSPHQHPEAVEALLPLTDVMLVDSDDIDDPSDAFARVEHLRDYAYIVDLAWLRTTPWRERLAATFDLPDRRAALEAIEELEIRHRETSMASALLLAGWLSTRLHWERSYLRLWDGRRAADGLGGGRDVVVSLHTAEQEAPGLAGVTVHSGDGSALSLQRGLGGLDATERTPDGVERAWKILGASRGEGGILGEGVRQTLLRDPTYLPALQAARKLSPA